MSDIPVPPVEIDAKYENGPSGYIITVQRDQKHNEAPDGETVYFTLQNDEHMENSQPLPSADEKPEFLFSHVDAIRVFAMHPSTNDEEGARYHVTTYAHGEFTYTHGFRTSFARDAGNVRYASELLVLPPKKEIAHALKNHDHDGTFEFVLVDTEGKVVGYDYKLSQDAFESIEARPMSEPVVSFE